MQDLYIFHSLESLISSLHAVVTVDNSNTNPIVYYHTYQYIEGGYHDYVTIVVGNKVTNVYVPSIP